MPRQPSRVKAHEAKAVLTASACMHACCASSTSGDLHCQRLPSTVTHARALDLQAASGHSHTGPFQTARLLRLPAPQQRSTGQMWRRRDGSAGEALPVGRWSDRDRWPRRGRWRTVRVVGAEGAAVGVLLPLPLPQRRPLLLQLAVPFRQPLRELLLLCCDHLELRGPRPWRPQVLAVADSATSGFCVTHVLIPEFDSLLAADHCNQKLAHNCDDKMKEWR